MRLEETEARLAINPVASQPIWLLGFLLSFREISLTLRFGLDHLGLREKELWSFSWRSPNLLGEESP